MMAWITIDLKTKQPVLRYDEPPKYRPMMHEVYEGMPSCEDALINIIEANFNTEWRDPEDDQ